jgi:dihydrofolate synthase / folylpolyglutamate synthase
LESSLNAWLERIERLHAKPIELGLDRVRDVAARLDIALDAPIFVVAGTNGKGSTCAMLEAILRAAGYRVGLYTSPHLRAFNERARIDGIPTSDAALVEQFEAVEAARRGTTLTYFEFTTLAILRLFAQARLDTAVLEVGLGGRLDAVNLVDADVSIVTSIDIDHVDYLGSTRDAIALEKAHVYRAGRAAICSDPRPPATLTAHAERIGADLWLFGRDFNYQGDRQQWAYAGRRTRRAGLPYPSLRGANQLLNASGALAALEAVEARLPVAQQAVRQGLLTVDLPGRFQILPGRPTIILDVAHNPHAAAVLAENLDSMGFYPATSAVFGMLADKDIGGVVARVGDRINHWYAVATAGPRGASAASIADAVRSALSDKDVPVTACAAVAEAFDLALGAASANDRIIAFGSFLVVSDAIAALAVRERSDAPRTG